MMPCSRKVLLGTMQDASPRICADALAVHDRSDEKRSYLLHRSSARGPAYCTSYSSEGPTSRISDLWVAVQLCGCQSGNKKPLSKIPHCRWKVCILACPFLGCQVDMMLSLVFTT